MVMCVITYDYVVVMFDIVPFKTECGLEGSS